MSFKVKDHYYKKAKNENFLARSVYKLEEIDKKFQVLRKGDLVLDLGYYPGSWIQYASQKIGKDGRVIGVDLKEINKEILSSKNVELFQKDIFEINNLEDLNIDQKFNVVLSDMAPNTTGIKSVDQDRSLNLVEQVFYSVPKFLKERGNLVIKVFDSGFAQTFLKENRKSFLKFDHFKPKSTRSVSKEFFVIGRGYKA